MKKLFLALGMVAALIAASAPVSWLPIWYGHRMHWVQPGAGLALDTAANPPVLSVRIPGCKFEDGGLTCESLNTSGSGAGQLTMAGGPTPPKPRAGQFTLFFTAEGRIMVEDSTGTVRDALGTPAQLKVQTYQPTVPTADYGIQEAHASLQVFRNGILQTAGLDYRETPAGVEFSGRVPGPGEVVSLVYIAR